jgi:hypothetical protein
VVGGLPAHPVVHLDAGDDDQPCRQALAARGTVGEIATRGVPAPIQAGRRWPVERTHAWGNQYGKLHWCTQRRRQVVEFWLALANAAIVCGRLVGRAWTCYRWQHPTPPPMTPTGAAPERAAGVCRLGGPRLRWPRALLGDVQGSPAEPG